MAVLAKKFGLASVSTVDLVFAAVPRSGATLLPEAKV